MKKDVRAHRWSYEACIGEIPKDLVIDHMCRNKPCVNPKHLRAITAVMNTMIGNGPPAINARKTHCLNGHEFTKENSKKTVTGKNCKTCFNKLQRDGFKRIVSKNKKLLKAGINIYPEMAPSKDRPNQKSELPTSVTVLAE